jgi:molecular chaperone GrpE
MSDEKKPADQTPPANPPANPDVVGAAPAAPAASPFAAPPALAAQAPAAQAESGSAAAPEIGAAQFKDMIAALQAELDKKSAALADKHDLYVRAVAETENVRRRMEKEKEDTAKYAITKFARDVFSVGDNFQRAISAVPAEAAEKDPALKNFLDGVILAERDFRGALEKNGVRLIDPAGQPFNPHHHQAVMEQENTSVPAGTVLQVFEPGYLIDERCLRPAMVIVSRGGPKAGKRPDAAPEAAAPGPAPTGSESDAAPQSDQAADPSG